MCLSAYTFLCNLPPVKDGSTNVCLQVNLNALMCTDRSEASARSRLFCAGKGSRGIGSTGRAASILGLQREIRHEIKALVKGAEAKSCHLIQHYLYSQERKMMMISLP